MLFLVCFDLIIFLSNSNMCNGNISNYSLKLQNVLSLIKAWILTPEQYKLLFLVCFDLIIFVSNSNMCNGNINNYYLELENILRTIYEFSTNMLLHFTV